MGEKREVHRDLVGALKERDHLEDQGVDGRMEIEWCLGTLAGGCGVDPIGSG
jgi:hypothetical protein